jgi:hypothetical protein
VSRFVTPRERVDIGAIELFASVGRPLGSGLEARAEGLGEARIAPDVPAFLFSGTPIVVFGDTAAAGEGRLVLEWEVGGRKRTLAVPLMIGEGGDGETLRLLQGARLITDFESRYPGGEGRPGVEGQRAADRVRKRLVALSQAYGLVSREVGLVAVVERVGDQPGDIPVTRVVPVGLAQDVEMGAYFSGGQRQMVCSLVDNRLAEGVVGSLSREDFLPCTAPSKSLPKSFFPFSPGSRSQKAGPKEVEESGILILAASLEPDGGMPGRSEEERVQATVLALLQFLAEGHSAKHGAFRAHIKRMLEFLKKTKVRSEVVAEIVERAKEGRPLAGDWSTSKPGPDLWAELEKAIKQAAGA